MTVTARSRIFQCKACGKIEAAGAKALSAMDAELVGSDIIHSVINPIHQLRF